MRVIVTFTVIVKVYWFVGKIIVHLISPFNTIVARSHQVCYYTLKKIFSDKLRAPTGDAQKYPHSHCGLMGFEIKMLENYPKIKVI